MHLRPLANREHGESGADFLVHPNDAARPPRLRLRAALQRIVLGVDDTDLAFAHIPADRHDLQLALRDGEPFHLVPPIRSALLRDAPTIGDERYVGHWSEHFARTLVAERALPPGHFAITPALDAAPPRTAALGPCWDAASEIREVLALRGCLTTEAIAWISLGSHGSGHAFRLRRPSGADASRVRSWRKRAREGALPPVLVFYVSGLTMFAVLDGHDRLAAAVAEGFSPPVLVLWQPRERARPVDRAVQSSVWDVVQTLHEARGDRPPTLAETKQENDLLQSVADTRHDFSAMSRAERLWDDQVAWEARLRRALGAEGARMLSDGVC